MKPDTPDHPKVKSLCAKLRIKRAEALGYLELLWNFTSRYATNGDIGQYDDARIEAALDWPPDITRYWRGENKGNLKGALISALIECGWIDRHEKHRLVIHDWADHAPAYVLRRATQHTPKTGTTLGPHEGDTRATLGPHEGDARVTLGLHEDATKQNQHIADNSVKKTLPYHTIPDHTYKKERTHTQKSTGLERQNGVRVISPKFHDAFGMYPLRENEILAQTAWKQFVPENQEQAAVDCIRRFAASGRAGRDVGVKSFPRFLAEQSANGWAGDWPPARKPKRSESDQAVFDAMEIGKKK